MSKTEDKFMKWMSKYLEVYDSIYWEELELNIMHQFKEGMIVMDSIDLFELIYNLEKCRLTSKGEESGMDKR